MDRADLKYISPRAQIAPNVLISPGVRIYGFAKIESGVILGHGVIIGHPSPIEQKSLRQALRTGRLTDISSDKLNDEVVQTATTIEEGATIRSGSTIYSGAFIGSGADLAHNCLVREGATIGSDTHLLTGTQVMASVSIGSGCRIAGTLCNRTSVGHATSMLGHAMHNYKVGVPGHIEEAPRIHNGVVVGREVAIVGGVEVGDFAILGAGAVVTRPVPERTIWVGNPAKQVGVRDLSRSQELVERVKTYEQRARTHSGSR